MTFARIVTALLFVGAVVLAVPATASADPSAQVVAGRERIKVTIVGYQFGVQNCRVDPDADGNTQSLAMHPSGTMVIPVAAGTRRVIVWCPEGGAIYGGLLRVQPADLLLDLQDAVFAAAGSSNLVTDQALR